MRVKALFAPGDYAGGDVAKQAEIEAFFARTFPGVADPAFDARHAGMAVAALNPPLAAALGALSRLLILDTGWAARAALRELAIQTVNLRFDPGYSFAARRPNAEAAGIGADRLAALPQWRTSPLFDAEQRLVIAYTEAVMAGAVADDLFAEITARYGETEAVELTTIIGIWSAWAMLLGAVQPAVPEG